MTPVARFMAFSLRVTGQGLGSTMWKGWRGMGGLVEGSEGIEPSVPGFQDRVAPGERRPPEV